MSTIAVSLKHAGKKYDVDLPLSENGLWLKQRNFELTGVPVEKVKILVKGGQLKDDADLSKLGLKDGHQFMVIGTAGELPKAPTKPVVFLEDMSDKELAQAVKTPGGLNNLGNTCYMNSCIQVLRSIPELQVALEQYPGSLNDGSRGTGGALTASLRDLYRDLGQTSAGYPPMLFWQVLRQHVPQFQEMREGHPAQQDAQECWIQVLQALKTNLEAASGPSAQGSSMDASQAAVVRSKFVQKFMTGEMRSEMKCPEAPEEEPTTTSDHFDDLKCHITATTNYMATGIKDSLSDTIEKTSPTLGRTAVYEKQSKITRMPAYLTVVYQRFFWRSDLRKKVKIMRQVKFTFDLDVLDLLEDSLAKRVTPVNRRIKEIEKDRRERAKVRRRTKMLAQEAEHEARQPGSGTSNGMDVDKKEGEEAGEEMSVREKERLELEGLIDPELKKDVGSNPTGMYQLWGIVSHKGASADGGHYIAWVRKSAKSEKDADADPDKDEWLCFNDEKVSTVPRSRIEQLAGGGEDSAAYVLLYRAVDLS